MPIRKARKTSVPSNFLYVATTGNNGNAGTLASPFLTISAAVASAACVAGTTIFVRVGTYSSLVSISKSGTAVAPITIRNYPGEAVIIDGTSTAAASDLVSISGSYIQFQGFEIANAKSHGILVYQTQHVVLIGNTVHTCPHHGIWVGGDTPGATLNNYIIGNTTYDCSRSNLNGVQTGGGWASGIIADNADGTQIIGNIAYQNWGEGINVYRSGTTLVAYNVVHDNWSMEIYTANSSTTTVRNNFVYSTGLTAFYSSGTPHPAEGIGMAMETTANSRSLTGMVIINNIIGPANRYGIYYGNYDLGGGLQNAVIANNTVINCTGANIHIDTDAGHSGNIIKNNIFYQASAGTNTNTAGVGATYDYNSWFNGTSGASAGAHDVTTDPKLVLAAANSFVPTDYQLQSNSPLLTAGVTVASVIIDYWDKARPASLPSIGAYQS